MIVVEQKKPAMSSGPMNKAEASAITKRIRKATDELYELVDQARQRQAWKPLGYSSWEAYVKAEFDMSARHSYRLIDYAEVAREIDTVAGESVTRVSQISVRDAAAVKHDLPAVTAEIKARVDAGEEPKKVVTETVKAKRAEKEQQQDETKVEQAKAETPAQSDAFDRFIALVDQIEAIPIAALVDGIGRRRAVLGQRASSLADRMSDIMEGLDA